MDDVIATLASKIEAARGCAVILSTDKVFLQLLSDSIRVRDHFARHYLDQHATFATSFRGRERLMADLLALAGDPTNNIPGVPSVGRKISKRAAPSRLFLPGECAAGSCATDQRPGGEGHPRARQRRPVVPSAHAPEERHRSGPEPQVFPVSQDLGAPRADCRSRKPRP